MDEYSVEQINSQHKCFYNDFIVQWECTWYVKSSDFTYWETGVNSYLTNTHTYFNMLPVTTNAAASWGLAWYWSYNDGKKYVSDWEYGFDHCLAF